MAPKYRYRQATIPDGHTWNSDEWHLKDSPGTSKSPCGTITNDTSAGKTYIASGATAPSPELRTCRHTIKESPRHLSRSTHAISTYLSIGERRPFRLGRRGRNIARSGDIQKSLGITHRRAEIKIKTRLRLLFLLCIILSTPGRLGRITTRSPRVLFKIKKGKHQHTLYKIKIKQHKKQKLIKRSWQ